MPFPCLIINILQLSFRNVKEGSYSSSRHQFKFYLMHIQMQNGDLTLGWEG